MTWKSMRWLLFIAIFLLFVGFFLQPILDYNGYWNVFYPANTIEKITIPDYQSNSPIQIFNFQPKESVPIELQDVDISFNFKNNLNDKTEGLLQTADHDGLAVLLGFNQLPVVAATTDNGQQYFVGRIVTLPISTDQWHSIRIHFWNQHYFDIWLDGKHTLSNQSNMNLQLSQIKLGSSFENYQRFEGIIKNFSLVYGKINIDLAYKLLIFRHILCGLGVILFIYFLRFWSTQPILTKNQKIEWFSFSLLIAFVAMMTYHFIVSVYFSDVVHSNTFLFTHSWAFSDWFITLHYGLNPYNISMPAIYFPFSYIFLYPFFLIYNIALPVAIIIFTGFVIAFVTYYCRLDNLEKNNLVLTANIKNIFIISLLSYPFWFAFERGNLEEFIFIFLGIFLYFYQKKKFYWAAFMIACAGAMKVYPLVFLLIFIAERQYRAAIFCMLMTAILTIISLCILQGGFFSNFHSMLSSISAYGLKDLIVQDATHNAIFSLSLFAFFYKGLHFLDTNITAIQTLNYYYLSVFIFLIFFTLYFICIKQALWKKIFLLVSVMLLLPPSSGQYKLLYLFLPLALFINETDVDFDNKDVSYLIMFIILFIPINYNLSEKNYDHFFSIVSNITCPAALLIGSIAIIVSGLHQRRITRQ